MRPDADRIRPRYPPAQDRADAFADVIGFGAGFGIGGAFIGKIVTQDIGKGAGWVLKGQGFASCTTMTAGQAKAHYYGRPCRWEPESGFSTGRKP